MKNDDDKTKRMKIEINDMKGDDACILSRNEPNQIEKYTRMNISGIYKFQDLHTFFSKFSFGHEKIIPCFDRHIWGHLLSFHELKPHKRVTKSKRKSFMLF